MQVTLDEALILKMDLAELEENMTQSLILLDYLSARISIGRFAELMRMSVQQPGRRRRKTCCMASEDRLTRLARVVRRARDDLDRLGLEWALGRRDTCAPSLSSSLEASVVRCAGRSASLTPGAPRRGGDAERRDCVPTRSVGTRGEPKARPE